MRFDPILMTVSAVGVSLLAAPITTPAFPAGPANARTGASQASATVYGLHADSMYYSGDPERLDVQAGVHSRINRWTLLWKNVEAAGDLPPGSADYDWSAADATLDNTRARGMDNLLVLGTSPGWANGSSDPWVVPQEPEAVQEWADKAAEFAHDAAAHFADRGYTGLRWEVWNEPNEVYFWKHPTMGTDYSMTAANRQHYAILFDEVRAALLRADPTARVALGGITGLGATCCLEGSRYIANLIDLDGVVPEYVGVHSYTGQGQGPEACLPFERNFTNTGLARQVLDERGLAEVRLWLTEWGWDSAEIGEDLQAEYIARGLEMIRDQTMSCGGTEHADHGITVATLFMDIDTAEYTYGIFDSELNPKPAAAAYREFTADVGQASGDGAS